MIDWKTYKVPLGVDVRDGKIIDIGIGTHRVDWDESGPSSILYCNGCGSPFFIEARTREFELVEICANCKVILRSRPPQ